MTVETVSGMDELPTLSFTPSFSQTTSLRSPDDAADSQLDGITEGGDEDSLSCSSCGQQFQEVCLLQLHRQMCHALDSSSHPPPNFLGTGNGDLDTPSVGDVENPDGNSGSTNGPELGCSSSSKECTPSDLSAGGVRSSDVKSALSDLPETACHSDMQTKPSVTVTGLFVSKDTPPKPVASASVICINRDGASRPAVSSSRGICVGKGSAPIPGKSTSILSLNRDGDSRSTISPSGLCASTDKSSKPMVKPMVKPQVGVTENRRVGRPPLNRPGAGGSRSRETCNQPLPSYLNNFSGHCTRNQKRQFRAFAQLKARQSLKRMVPWDDSRPLHAHWAPKRTRKAVPEPHPSCVVDQSEFAMVCGLVSSANAERRKPEAEQQQEEVELDCQIVAVEGPLFGGLIHSPRTTRSLMSQLSRENMEAGRKRLSFGHDSDDDSDSETLDRAATRRSIQVSLLAIDRCSPLGQRVKKHMKGDLAVPPITDIEQHCMTVPVLDEMAAKLRHRASEYPIMHRKRKGIISGYCHTYKFSRADHREFMHTLQTGLNARSRRLLRQTKKSTVYLTRLRAEEIRYWTIKRRTIVREEIAIDDDISIVQVEVPEHLFNAVQSRPVPSHARMLYQDVQAMPGHRALQGQLSRGPKGAEASSSLVDVRTPRPSSSLMASTPPSGPRPQFLVKQVSKNWTENGQESQKLVFVPLEEMGCSPLPNLTVRSIPSGSTQRPYGSSSTGVKKLPPHLRPCPKSRRKQRLLKREESQDDFIIETASSSSEEDARSKDRVTVSPWIVTDQPVPQMLHVANSTSGSIPVSAGLVPFLADMVPVTALEMQAERPGRPGLLQHHLHSPVVSASDSHPQLRKHLAVLGGSWGDVEHRDNHVSDADAVLATGSGRGTDDAAMGQGAASTAKQHASHQPNFLHVDAPKTYDSHRHGLPSLHVAHQHHLQASKSATRGNLPPLILGVSKHQSLPSPSSDSGAQEEKGRSHMPSILRGAGRQLSPPVPGLGRSATVLKCSPTTPSPSSTRTSSSKDWKVVRACDDDVVEVICIDDDD